MIVNGGPRAGAAPVEHAGTRRHRRGAPTIRAMSSPPGHAIQRPVRYLELLARAAAHVDAHLDSDLGADVLAERAAMSRHHFHRIFRAYFGTTVQAYATWRRLQRARELLAAGDRTVLDVALEVGDMSRAAKQAYGELLPAVQAAGLMARMASCIALFPDTPQGCDDQQARFLGGAVFDHALAERSGTPSRPDIIELSGSLAWTEVRRRAPCGVPARRAVQRAAPHLDRNLPRLAAGHVPALHAAAAGVCATSKRRCGAGALRLRRLLRSRRVLALDRVEVLPWDGGWGLLAGDRLHRAAPPADDPVHALAAASARGDASAAQQEGVRLPEGWDFSQAPSLAELMEQAENKRLQSPQEGSADHDTPRALACRILHPIASRLERKHGKREVDREGR